MVRGSHRGSRRHGLRDCAGGRRADRRVDRPWPVPSKLPTPRALQETMDEYQRRAVALGSPRGRHQRDALIAYRVLCAQMHAWLALRAQGQARSVVPSPGARPRIRPLLREALAECARAGCGSRNLGEGMLCE